MGADSNNQEDFDPAFEDGGEDYSYDEESFDGEDYGDEESWSDEGGEESDSAEGTNPKTKKKGSLFNVILIAVAILGGGGFLYLKILAPAGKTAAPAQQIADTQAPVPSPVEQQASLPQPVASSPVAPETVADGVVATGDSPLLPVPGPEEGTEPSSQGDQLSALSPVEMSDEPPMPSPIATAEEEMVAPEAQAPTTMKMDSESDFQPALPKAADIMIDAPVAKVEAAPVTNAPVLAQDPAVDTTRLEEKMSVLITRLDSFEGRINALETGIHQLSKREAASAPAAAAASVDLSGIEESLASLSAKLDKLEKAQGATPKVVEKTSAPAPKAEEPTFVPAAEEEPAVPASKVRPDAEPVVQDTPKTEPAKPVVRVTAASQWVLRSAQPGMAMVSSKTNNETRSVRVGDTLAGLGKVISIGLEGNRWVVKGTQGSLTH
ncbi:MAG: hypothetical protein ACK4NR_01605 [Micavibrio sp.]